MNWMFKEDDYVPQANRDAFVDKSILSFVKVLARIKRNGGQLEKSYIYRVNPMLKFISILVSVLLVSLSNSPSFVLLTMAMALTGFILLDRESRKRARAMCMLALLLSFVMLIPSMLAGNVRNSLMILLKLAVTVSMLYVFSYTTRWHEVTKTLKLFFIPDIFILIFDITIRYIFLLGEMALDMLQALKKRSIGINRERFATMSRLMGNLFIKSAEAGSEMYFAMECRGYTGEYIAGASRHIGKEDIVYGSIWIIVVIAYFLLNKKI